MGTINEFINDFGYSNEWFVEYVNEVNNQMRVMGILDIKEYLSGAHAISKRPNEVFNGKEFVPRRIILNYAVRLLAFGTAYLIGNKVTLTGNEKVVDAIKSVYKNGYDKLDFDLVHSVNRYGNAYEYVYVKDGKITSKLIDVADSFPVVSSDNEYIAFVESYTVSNVTFYNVYYPDRVERYSNGGGTLQSRGTFSNLSGLPVLYRNDNPIDDVYGRSDLEDYQTILDSMEDLLSKSVDAFHRFIIGTPIIKGQMLTNNEGLSTRIVGQGLTLDSDSDFYYAQNKFDHAAFETLYKHLMTSLLDISSCPGIVMGKVDISNLSEVSIKLLFSLSNLKAMIGEKYIKEGMKQRNKKIRRLLELQGIVFEDAEWDTLDIVFQYAQPQSESDVIDNLKVLKDMGAISVESILGHSPYTTDVNTELLRLDEEGNKNTAVVDDGNKV
ncbi:phage portal protein [Paenibacillus sp. B2(2019)]|uniref:phage portal protein n=1 Tax=Paenibacillus sp. B2(2019) TaxID=2607754 RepID=UPI0011F345F1|nr:phage portal protein [Paenibacillus sp. B2(2019)]KAA1191121.1 phage portal protein [Paenibacillus sp. B2(2019)]